MAESIYKVPTASVGPDGKPVFDVFEGTRKLELPEFQQRRLNIDQLQIGAAPTGFTTQFKPVTLDVSRPVPMEALESTTTQTDNDRLMAENIAAQNAQRQRMQDLTNQAAQKMILSPEEKAAQARLLGYQQIQEAAIQGAQDRPLDGTVLKAGLASEIQNISSGNTRESLINIRKQTQEAQTLNLLTQQREQELAAIKLQLDQGNIDTQNLMEAQKLNEDIKNSYLDRVQTLGANARTTLSTILDKFSGLTLEQLSPASAAQIGMLAQQSGIPMEVIAEGMKVAKNQLDIKNAQENFRNQTARINATTTGTTSGVTTATGKPLTAAQATALGYYDRMKASNDVISAIGGQFSGASSYIGSLLPFNIMKSDSRQQFEQAQRDFVNAKLRQESGAAISPTEFESAVLQYFPQPGDSQAVIDQKARNRQTVINSQATQAGQNPVVANDPLGIR